MDAPDRDGSTLLCTLSASGVGAPLFLVPSIGSTPLSLVRLARSIAPRRPVHAFAYAGLEDDRPPHRTVEAIAEACVDELLAFSPRGPRLLGGHCLGGVVALEIALQMEARGERVEKLAVLDSYPPWRLGDVGSDERPRKVAGLWSSGGAARRGTEAIAARALEHFPMLDAGVRARLRALTQLHVDASLAYLGRPVRARTHVLCSEGWDASLVEGWSALAIGRVVRHELPGDTFSMLRPPHVEAAGRVLGRALAEFA
ncbi:MAG: alpha/beta fold hydrolase [Betaproteobacteria bacterium]